MTKYEEIISNLQQIDAEKSEYMQEEIDIMIHKLKFLSKDNFPKTLILNQSNDYALVFDNILKEKVSIAGGILLDDITNNPDCIIFIQENENLYNEITDKLNSPEISRSSAVTNNNIYIIQSKAFNSQDENYLADTEALAEILQPKYFFYGGDGESWVKFNLQ